MGLLGVLGTILLLHLVYRVIDALHLSVARRRYYDRRIRRLRWIVAGLALVMWSGGGAAVYLLWTKGVTDPRTWGASEVLVCLIITAVAQFAWTMAGDHLGRTSLMQAAADANFVRVRDILNGDVDVNLRDVRGYSAIMFAISGGNEEMVSLLFSRGTDLEVRDLEGRTPLMWSIATNTPGITRMLLAHGADVTAKSLEGYTARDYALRSANAELRALFPP